MAEHYTRNTTAVMRYCNTCRRQTMHRVDDRRVGSCLEHSAGPSKKQERQRQLQEQQAQNPEFQF